MLTDTACCSIAYMPRAITQSLSFAGMKSEAQRRRYILDSGLLIFKYVEFFRNEICWDLKLVKFQLIRNINAYETLITVVEECVQLLHILITNLHNIGLHSEVDIGLKVSTYVIISIYHQLVHHTRCGSPINHVDRCHSDKLPIIQSYPTRQSYPTTRPYSTSQPYPSGQF
jgi:hypothetical protein